MRDALGTVEFLSQEERRKNPVREMRAYGTHCQPAGTWSDDTSLKKYLISAYPPGMFLIGGRILSRRC